MTKQLNIFNEEDSGAEFSPDLKHRFVLWRIWNFNKPKIMFIGLNPSTANAEKNDQTISRLINISKNLGFGGLYMLNLFTYITPYPNELIQDNNIIINKTFLFKYYNKSERVVFCWGNFIQAQERSKYVIRMFPNAYCIAKNKNGSPKHPLYCNSKIELIEFHGKTH